MQKRSITRAALQKLRASWAVSPLPDPDAIPAKLWLISTTAGNAVTVTDHKVKPPEGYQIEQLTVKG